MSILAKRVSRFELGAEPLQAVQRFMAKCLAQDEEPEAKSGSFGVFFFPNQIHQKD